MRVMLTGGTGFIGYHTTLALLEAGHEVSLLVRSVDKMLNLFGNDRIAHFTRGDITDAAQVRLAMRDCDAVIHTAAMVSTHSGDAEKVMYTNVQGAKTVIGSAVELGIGAIIHVSSVTALFDPDADVLDENSPPGKASNGYGRSKVTCEKYVRELQAQGHPVYITYPASVIGPDDPGMTEPNQAMCTFLAHFVPRMSSGNQWVDVRDVASVHLQLLQERPPAGRYVLGGHYLPWRQLGGVLQGVTGRRLLQLPLNGSLMRLAGRLCDAITPRLNLEVPITREGMTYATNWVVMDNTKVETDLGFEFRPVEDSMADCIRWLYLAGHVTAEQAGELAHD
ncbi:MAG: SDR family NAD(P)-dependent oxidoreductase [Halioglobus sp.]